MRVAGVPIRLHIPSKSLSPVQEVLRFEGFTQVGF